MFIRASLHLTFVLHHTLSRYVETLVIDEKLWVKDAIADHDNFVGLIGVATLADIAGYPDVITYGRKSACSMASVATAMIGFLLKNKLNPTKTPPILYEKNRRITDSKMHS